MEWTTPEATTQTWLTTKSRSLLGPVEIHQWHPDGIFIGYLGTYPNHIEIALGKNLEECKEKVKESINETIKEIRKLPF